MSLALPYENAEKALLGSLMKENNRSELAIPIVSAGDFATPTGGLIFDLIIEARAKGLPSYDPASLYIFYSEKVGFDLSTKTDLDLFGVMQDLFLEAPVTLDPVYFARAVKSQSLQRRSAELAKQMSNYLAMGKDPRALIEEMASLTTTPENNLIDSRDAISEAVDRYQSAIDNQNGLFKTGFDCLDAKLGGGLSPGDLTVIAARPGMGKTQFALNLFMQASKCGNNPLFLSFEMPTDQIIGRLSTMISGVPLRRILSGKAEEHELDAFTASVTSLYQISAKFCDRPLTPKVIESEIKQAKSVSGTDVVFIDYLQLIPSDERHPNREREIAEISKAMKLIAKTYGVRLICLAQLNRAVEHRASKKPLVSDLRDSGSIEQDADQIMLLYRSDYYDKEEGQKSENPGALEINLAKNRHGETGNVMLSADMGRGLFSETPFASRGFNPF